MVSNENQQNTSDQDIDLGYIFSVLLRRKLLLLGITSFITLLVACLSLFMPNIYRSTALLVPVEQNDEMGGGGLGGSVSSAAALVGIDLGGLGQGDLTDQAIEVIESLNFFEEYIYPIINPQDFIAIRSWNYKTGEIKYNKRKFDAKSNSWTRKVNYPLHNPPSAQEVYKIFKQKNLFVNKDKQTNFVEISVQHHSPILARDLLDSIIDNVNTLFREDEKDRATQSVSYINDSLYSTDITEVRIALSELLKRETQKLMLVEVNEEYVLKVLQPAYLPERKSRPNRVSITIIGLILGFILSSGYVLFTERRNDRL